MNSFICVILVSALVGTQSKPSCPQNEILSICGKRCEDTCKNVLLKTRPCLLICDPPACVCKYGYARHSNGTCLAIWNCPIEEFECGENEEASICGNLCENKCGRSQYELCLRPCLSPACACKAGFARQDDVLCVPIVNC